MHLETTTPGESGSADGGWRVFSFQVAALAGAYVVSGWFGLGFAFYQENVTLIWPPTGICLAALILWGRRLWIGVWLGALALSLMNGSPVSVALGFAVGNTLMAVVGALLLVHVFDFHPSLDRVRDVMALVFVSGALASMISAGIGVATLWLHGSLPTSEIGAVLSIWWRGDLGGIVAVAPLFLLLKGGRLAWRSLFRELEFWIAAAVGVVLLWYAYSGIVSHDSERIAIRLVFPLLFGAAIRLEMRGIVLLNFVLLLVAEAATGAGLGPLATLDPYPNTSLLWIFLMVAGCTSLALGAAVHERKLVEELHSQGIIEKMQIEREQMITRERERIMRDMHDGIGGQLVSVLSMVQRGSATNDEISEALRRALDDMRLMIDPYNAREVNFAMMLGRLRASFDAVLRRNGLRATWEIEPLEALDALDPAHALHALRIIQEAVANVIQHAQATQIKIRVFAADPTALPTVLPMMQTIAIEIADNGVGSTPDSPGDGYGTRNMKDRAEALGADLRIEIRDSGRTVSLRIPVSPPASSFP